MDADRAGAMSQSTRTTVAALILVTVLTTGHRFANGFVFDDVHVIEEGTVIHDLSNLGAVFTHHTMIASSADPGVQSIDTYRPVTLVLFMIDAAIGGRATWPYHTTNLVLHLLCVLGVFGAALRWLEDRTAALYGALVFATHPWSVEAHVWINGRSDPACLAFGLAALLALLHAERTRSVRWCAAGAVLLLLGLLSKETLLLVFPALLLMPAAHGGERWMWGRAAALAPAAAVYLALRAAVLGGLRTHADTMMLGEAAARLPWLLLDAVRGAVAPQIPYLRSLRDEYAGLAAWQEAAAAAAIAIFVVAAWTARRRAPVAAWSALWFFAPLVPIAIVSTVLWPGFGRFLYVPLAAFAWGLAALVSVVRKLVPRPRLRVAFAALHVAALSGLAASFTHDFATSETLYGRAIETRPDIAMGYGWLGMARASRGDDEGALPLLLRATELDPETHRYLAHAGRSALAVGRRDLASELAARGLRRFSGTPEEASYHLIAVNAMAERDPEVAVEHLARCLEVNPDRPDCRDALDALLRDPIDGAANRAALERRRQR